LVEDLESADRQADVLEADVANTETQGGFELF
jgi:hypothetical protein